MLTQSTIYYPDTNSTEKTDETYEGKPFFRKHYGEPHPFLDYSKQVELTIIKILMQNHHRNIVTYYHIYTNHIDIEQVDSEKSNSLFFDNQAMTREDLNEIIEVMTKVKDFLQALGIMYVDWKFDNMGKALDGSYKLFDFDASGLIDLLSMEWKLKPNTLYWSYNEAIKHGCKTPKEIDDWSFNYNIIEEGEKLLGTKNN
jgi:serine/threonine protein kinase